MAESTVPAKRNGQVPATREESRYLVPPVDIFETDAALVVVADLPGVSKDEIEVRVEDDLLTIDGKTQDWSKGESITSEFELRSFFRQFHLGEIVDQEKIEADLNHGVLTIQLPKVEKAQPKQIAVNFG